MVYYIYMTPIKEYTGEMFKGKRLHFKCDCLFPLDFIGTVRGYRINKEEIILQVDRGGKIIDIGLNHPKMTVEEV